MKSICVNSKHVDEGLPFDADKVREHRSMQSSVALGENHSLVDMYMYTYTYMYIYICICLDRGLPVPPAAICILYYIILYHLILYYTIVYYTIVYHVISYNII